MILWLLACTGPGVTETVEAPVEIRSWLEGEVSEDGGTFVVQVERPANLDVEMSVPPSDSLEIALEGEPEMEKLGDIVVDTQRWSFRGSAGHYEIPAATANWEGGTASSLPLYVDIAVEAPPSDEPMADITEPTKVVVIPWGWIALGVAVAATVLATIGAIARILLKSPPPPPIRRDPPDVLALRAWDAVRADPTLDDHAKAVELSRIYREYAEAVLRFPATKWTTRESVAHLEAMPHLPQGNVPRAKRLLRATDRVKYADAAMGGDVFEELDADLRAFVLTTAPVHYASGQ